MVFDVGPQNAMSHLQLGTNGHDRASIGDCSTNKLQYALVMCLGVIFLHQIDLVLENDDVVELHDLDSRKMLTGLWLRAGFVSGNEK